MKSKPILTGMLLSLLAACSSSDSNDDDNTQVETPNVAPTVSVSDATGIEGAIATVVATITDQDGSISSVEWLQTSGPNANFSTEGEQIEVELPAVSAQTELIFDITATDNEGASTTATFTIVVMPNTKTVNITGKVNSSSESMPQIPVSVTVGSESWETVSNESGVYEVEVVIDDAFFDLPIQLSAELSNEKFDQFYSMLPSVSSLGIEQDVIELGESSYTSVNLDSFNTAKYLMAVSQSSLTDINFETFDNSMDQVSPEFAFDALTFVEALARAVTDAPETLELLTALPEEMDSVYNLFANYEAFSDIIYEASKLNSDAWEAAADNVRQMTDASFSESNLGDWFISNLHGQIMLNSDGTGSIEKLHHSSFNWSLVEGNLEMSLTYDFYPAKVNGGYISRYVNEIVIEPVFANARGVIVEFTQYYEDYTLPEPDTQYSENLTLWHVNELASLDVILDTEESWYFDFNFRDEETFEIEHFPYSYGQLDVNTKVFKFSPSESDTSDYVAEVTYFTLGEHNVAEMITETIDVNVNDEHTVATFSLDNMNFELSLFDIPELGKEALSVDVTDSDRETFQDWELGIYMSDAERVTLSAEELVGKKLVIDHQPGKLYNRWYELSEDGTLKEYFAVDVDLDGVVSDEEGSYEQYYIDAGVWKVEDGTLHMLRYADSVFVTDENAACNTPWTPTFSDSCVVSSTRTLDFMFQPESGAVGYVAEFVSSYHDSRVTPALAEQVSPFIPSSHYYDLRVFTVLDQHPVVLQGDPQ